MSASNTLPSSWLRLKLGEIINYGEVDRVEPSEIPPDAWVLELEDIERDTSKLVRRLTFAQRQSKSTKNRFSEGDVLYSRLRPYLNKVLVADQEGYCTTEIIPLKPNQAINGRYLHYWLRHPEFLNYVNSVSHGLSMPRLGSEAALQAPLVLAPANEQQRIVIKLDVLLARVDACRSRLELVPPILQRFRQAVLVAAVSGRLTEDWRAESEPLWTPVSIDEIAEAIFDGPFGSHLKSDDYTETGVRVVRLENLGRLRFVDDNKTYISQQKYLSLQKHTLNQNDILFSSFVDEEVRVCLFPSAIGTAINKADCFCIRAKSDICLPEFLAICLASRSTYNALRELVHGATRPRVNLTQLKQLELRLPSVEEQYEIVRRVNGMFALVDGVEARYQAAHTVVERLMPALLTKAFLGALVEQDPYDESAAELVARIRAIQATVSTKKRRRRSNMKKTDRERENPAGPINIVQALREAAKELSSDDLLLVAGYPSSAESEILEEFFVAIRDALRNDEISKIRRQDTDWFSLKIQ